jgi:hypothetical protein
MKELYGCPHCYQTSTRRWNLKTHINRRHTGAGRPIPKIASDPLWTGGVEYKTGFKNDIIPITRHDPKATDTGDFLEQILQRLRKQKEIKDLCSELYGQQAPSIISHPHALNMGLMISELAATCGTTLGFKAYGCDKCLDFGIEQIFDHAKKTSLKLDHVCDQQRLDKAQFVKDIATTAKQRRQELTLYLTIIVDGMFQQEPIDLAAVEIPDHVFEKPISEEYVDLDSLSSGTAIDWAYKVALGHKTKIDRIVLAQLLAIFNATLGFFRLTIDGTKRYFFTYIAKGLEPRDIEYLKNLYTTDANISNGIGGSIHKHASNIAKNDMVQFVKAPFANEPIPMLRLNIFRASVNFQ